MGFIMSDLRAHRFFNQVVDVATGYSNMAFVTCPAGCIMTEIRYRSGQTGYCVGASYQGSGASFVPSVAGITLGIPVPSSAIGGLPMKVSGPYPFYLGTLGTSGVVFDVTRYFSSNI
jgi:hypothetical protein